MNTSTGHVWCSRVLDALFVLGDRETVCGAVEKAMPVERFCVLCNCWLRGREWKFEGDCPKCLGVDSLKTYSEYIRWREAVVARQCSRLHGGELPRRSIRIAGRRVGYPIEDLHRPSWSAATAVRSKIRKGRASKKGSECSSAEVMGRGKKSLILGLHEDLDESCAVGSGISAAIADLVGNVGLAQVSGEVEVAPRTPQVDFNICRLSV